MLASDDVGDEISVRCALTRDRAVEAATLNLVKRDKRTTVSACVF